MFFCTSAPLLFCSLNCLLPAYLKVLEEINNAIERQNYLKANLLLEQLQKREPDNPWFPFYLARLQECQGKFVEAEKLYREMLPTTTNSKIIARVRQGLQRLCDIETSKKQEAIDLAKSKPGGEDDGVLILEAIEPVEKATAAKKIAKIMEIDPYTARLQLPSRSWRLFRIGAIGELEFYVSELKAINIPCFCASLSQLNAIEVERVKYFKSFQPEIIIDRSVSNEELNSFHNSLELTDAIAFNWKDVSQKVEGLIPLFEEVVDTNKRGKTYRKTQILDYVKICDLHLPKQKKILRLCDRLYQFNRGINLSIDSEFTPVAEKTTASKNWHNLHELMQKYLPETIVRSEFTNFAETTMNFQEILRKIEPKINLLRREESLWDNAFELYSRLSLVKYL
jgi:tetratricopeptide (TPR) repeat protein